jgi:hypothetical protein
MNLPIRVFWTLCDQIPRIEAHQQRLALQVSTCAQSGEGATELFGALDGQIGEVVVAPPPSPLDVKMDKEGMEQLKLLTQGV